MIIIKRTGNSSIKDLLNLYTLDGPILGITSKVLKKTLKKIIFLFSFFIFSLGIKEERIEKITKIPPKISIIKIKGNQDEDLKSKNRKRKIVRQTSFIDIFKGFSIFVKERIMKILVKNNIKVVIIKFL